MPAGRLCGAQIKKTPGQPQDLLYREKTVLIVHKCTKKRQDRPHLFAMFPFQSPVLRRNIMIYIKIYIYFRWLAGFVAGKAQKSAFKHCKIWVFGLYCMTIRGMRTNALPGF